MKAFYSTLLYDLQVDKKTILNVLRYYCLNPSFKVMVNYRIGRKLKRSNWRLLNLLSSLIRMKLISKLGCDISFGAIIGNNFKLAHPICIVIGYGCIIGDNVTVYQGVTLGSNGSNQNAYPVIEDNVIIYANSSVIGNIRIGKNSIIGANTLVNRDVPANHKAFGNPLRIQPL